MLKTLQKLLPEKITDERERRSTTQLLQTLLVIFLAASGIGLGLAIIGPHKLVLGIPLAVLLVLGMACLFLLRQGKLLPVQVLLPTSLFIFTTYIVINGNGLHEVGLITYAIVIAMAGLTLGQEATLGFGLLIAVSVIGIGIAEMQGMIVNRASFLTNITAPFNLTVIVGAIAFIQRTLIQRHNEAIRHEHENKQAQIRDNAELRELQVSLENRVAERTQELDEANRGNARRAGQFKAITEVSRSISSSASLQKLLPDITNVISAQFGFYHVGIFLTDASNQYAVLGAANSPGGKFMLERGHQLKIGEQGIVGYAIGTGSARIALDVGKDATYFNNPYLPETHSEMALPLKIAGNTVGALDVQSTETNAFSDEDVEVLTALADQVSLAIQNARLFDQTQKALSEAEAAYRQSIKDTWSRLPQEQKLAGFRYNASGVTALDAIKSPQQIDGRKDSKVAANNERQEISVPIILRGETIGALSVQIPKQERVKADQMDLIKAVAERVALSAENARLFEETTRRAERERIVSDITTKIRSSVDPQEMIKTAMDELQRALGATRVEILPQKSSPPPDR